MTLEEFERLKDELEKSIDGHFYLLLPYFGDTATLDGDFTANELRQIATALDKLVEAAKLIEDKG